MHWKSVELRGYSYYSELGYRVLIPLVSGEGYDFVAEKNSEYIRVNVKCAGLKTKASGNSWSISIASGAGRKSVDTVVCDVYLTWLPSTKRFIEIPGDFLSGQNPSPD